MVTPWPRKLHHNVRQLAGKHIHMNRAMGLQSAGMLTWTRVQPDPHDECQREEAEVWDLVDLSGVGENRPVDRPAFCRHPKAIIHGYSRGVHEQQAIHG